MVRENTERLGDLEPRHLWAAILERYPAGPLDGRETKKSDKIDPEGLGDPGSISWDGFLARQQLKQSDDTERRAPRPEHWPTHFRPFRSEEHYQLVKQTYQYLQQSGFYWGALSMEDAHHMLSKTPHGTFLIRDSYQTNVFFTLSYHAEDQPKSIRLLLANQRFSMDGSAKTFDSLFGLLVHYTTLSSKIGSPHRRQRPQRLEQLGRRAVIQAHGAQAIDTLPGLNPQLRAYLHCYPHWL